MILGIGTDLMDKKRISIQALKEGDPFMERSFSPAERREAAARQDPRSYLAGRFAGKEAVFKAFGRNIPHARFCEIEILNDENGAPFVLLYGYTEQAAMELGVSRIHVSLSEEKEYCAAFAVLEGE